MFSQSHGCFRLKPFEFSFIKALAENELISRAISERVNAFEAMCPMRVQRSGIYIHVNIARRTRSELSVRFLTRSEICFALCPDQRMTNFRFSTLIAARFRHRSKYQVESIGHGDFRKV